MTNLAHAFITVSSIQNIFIMKIFTSGTLTSIHAPHRIRWPVLTYRLPIALDENIWSVYRLTLKSLSCVIQMSLVASFEWLVQRYVCNIYSDMPCWSHVSRTRDLMLKRDTMSSLNICCDVIRDIVEAWTTSSLSFTRDIIQDITRVLRKPWSLSDLGENHNDTFTRLLLLTYDWLSPRIDMLSSLRILHSPPWSGYVLFTDSKAWYFWCWRRHRTYAVGYVQYRYH